MLSENVEDQQIRLTFRCGQTAGIFFSPLAYSNRPQGWGPVPSEVNDHEEMCTVEVDHDSHRRRGDRSLPEPVGRGGRLVWLAPWTNGLGRKPAHNDAIDHDGAGGHHDGAGGHDDATYAGSDDPTPVGDG